MMKEFFNLIVVIPIGPDASPVFITDTIESVLFAVTERYKIILLDDSQQGTGDHLQQTFPGVDVVKTSKNGGSWAGLYIALSQAYAHALAHYRFDVLLKLDTDALIIAKAPEQTAMHLFTQRPEIGMAGQYPNEYNGAPWDTRWPRQRILNGTRSWKFIRRPRANWVLRKYYRKALKNGYKTGESVFGGAYFMSYACIEKLHAMGLLPQLKFRSLTLGEDHLFSLLVKSAGYELGDLSSGNLPFGCAWQGLPDSPEQLAKSGKKIIHSTKYWRQMDEKEIRRYFRLERENYHLQNA